MTDVDADGVGSVKGAWDRVRFICKRKSVQKRRLPRELGFSSDVSASVRSSSELRCVVVDINVAGEESSPGLGARVSLGVE